MSILNKFRSAWAHAKTGPATGDDDEADTQGLIEERRGRSRRNAREGTRALIIDDSPTVVFSLKKILQSAGFVTLEAGDAETGVHLAQTEAPEIIFLDIILPGVNGFAALRTLRKDALTAPIPVIMISGNEQATELFYGSRTGADDFMKKPFSRQEVFARIERLLDADCVPRRQPVAVAQSAADAAD